MNKRLTKWLKIAAAVMLVSILAGPLCNWLTPAPSNWQQVNGSMTRPQVQELGANVQAGQKDLVIRQNTWFGGRELAVAFDSTDRIVSVRRAWAVWPASKFM